jgi:DNA polymerase V
VADLRDADPRRMREQFGVVLERTVRELNGVACLDLEDMQPKKQIIASRAFGAPVYDQAELAESIREYMARAVRKLRLQGGAAGMVGAWVETNRFREQDAQYSPSATIPLAMPSDDIATLTAAAMQVLRAIYRPGFRYVKSGVMLLDLSDKTMQQGDLFASAMQPINPRRELLLATVDRANNRWGRQTIGLGSSGLQLSPAWAMQRSNLSPAYTTRWAELPVIRH